MSKRGRPPAGTINSELPIAPPAPAPPEIMSYPDRLKKILKALEKPGERADDIVLRWCTRHHLSRTTIYDFKGGKLTDAHGDPIKGKLSPELCIKVIKAIKKSEKELGLRSE